MFVFLRFSKRMIHNTYINDNLSSSNHHIKYYHIRMMSDFIKEKEKKSVSKSMEKKSVSKSMEKKSVSKSMEKKSVSKSMEKKSVSKCMEKTFEEEIGNIL